MDGTMVLPCTCKHEEQDKMYGKGNRVHNRGDKKGTPGYNKYYCTVCCTASRNKYRTTIDPMPHIGFVRSIIGSPQRKFKDSGILTL